MDDLMDWNAAMDEFNKKGREKYVEQTLVVVWVLWLTLFWAQAGPGVGRLEQEVGRGGRQEETGAGGATQGKELAALPVLPAMGASAHGVGFVRCSKWKRRCAKPRRQRLRTWPNRRACTNSR